MENKVVHLPAADLAALERLITMAMENKALEADVMAEMGKRIAALEWKADVILGMMWGFLFGVGSVISLVALWIFRQ